MATLEQLEEGIRRAHAAGDVDNVRILGAAYREMQGQSNAEPASNAEPEVPSPNIVERLGQSAASSFTGATQGATLGAYDELASLLGAPIKGVENLVTGQDSINGLGDVVPFLGRSFQSALSGQQALNQQAFEQAPAAYIAGDVAGALASGTGLAGTGATTFGTVARPTVANMLARGAGEGAITGASAGFNAGSGEGDTGLEARVRAAAEGGVLGALIGGASGGVLGGAAGRAQTKAIPTAQELSDQAGALYTAARQSGVTATPQMSQGITDTLRSIARNENIILPKSGNIDQSYPRIAGIINVMDEYAGEVLDVGRLQAIRRRIQDAAKSTDLGERRIGVLMLDEFDDFATSVAPELAEASDLYWRAKTGELIDQAIELAGSRSGQYSQSGMENALRTEFRALDRKIIKGQLRGIPPELAEQIRLVADGTPIQNVARQLGKFAVRGPVSAIPSILASGAGGAAGGPVGAALATGAVALPGEVGKRVAESISVRNANVASALARSGGALPEWEYAPASGAIVQALSNTGARLLPNF